MGMLTERMGGISIVGRGETVATREEIDRGGGVGTSGLLGSGVCSESQSLVCSVEKKRWEVHLEVVTIDRRVSGDEEQEVRVVVFVREGELMMFDKWLVEWKGRTEERRWRGGVSYSPPGQTLCVSTPT